MTTWILGDIHGCSRELERLIAALRLTHDDRLLCVGDLFHRGPDPVGVMEILLAQRAAFVLGNHEHAVLRRLGLAPAREAASGHQPVAVLPSSLDPAQLAGDGVPLPDVPEERRLDLLRFLLSNSGYFLEDRAFAGTGGDAPGRPWCVVHAGLIPGVPLERNTIRTLVGIRRLDGPGRPWWYESHRGPELVVFGHTPSALPRAWRSRGRLVALGIDTGCVYGGKLTAYSPELDEIVAVSAARAHARAG